MGKTSRAQLKRQREWRKKHKHYSRDYNRRARSSEPSRWWESAQRRTILGVAVDVNLLARFTQKDG
jgi:epoxyqueuosine reductase QueG